MVNKLRELFRQNKPTLGTHVSSPWPTVYELIGSTGQFDYIEHTGQYGSWDLHDLDNICRAAELTGISTVTKIDRNPKDWLAQRFIAAGFNGVLFADIMTAAEAKDCIKAIRLPPVGVNGWISTRGIPRGDWVEVTEDIVIGIMLEKKSLMDEFEDVLAIDGIDFIQFGPMDYSLSLRTPGQPFNRASLREKINADMDKAHQMALDAGVRPRVEVGDPARWQHFIDQGIRDFCIGSDTGMIRSWCMENGKKLRSLLSP